MKRQPPANQLTLVELAPIAAAPAYNPMLAKLGPANPGRYCYSCVYFWEQTAAIGEPFQRCLLDHGADPPTHYRATWPGCYRHLTELENRLPPDQVTRAKAHGQILTRASQLEEIAR